MIKTFDEFKQTERLDEGLLDIFKIRKQFCTLQGLVVDEYEKLLDENPKKFKDGETVMAAVEQFARKAYKKIITSEDALTFSQWWEQFKNANANMLNNTIFKIQK